MWKCLVLQVFTLTITVWLEKDTRPFVLDDRCPNVVSFVGSNESAKLYEDLLIGFNDVSCGNEKLAIARTICNRL